MSYSIGARKWSSLEIRTGVGALGWSQLICPRYSNGGLITAQSGHSQTRLTLAKNVEKISFCIKLNVAIRGCVFLFNRHRYFAAN